MVVLVGIIGGVSWGIVTRQPSPEEIRISQLSDALDREMEKNPKIKQLSDSLQEAIDDNADTSSDSQYDQ